MTSKRSIVVPKNTSNFRVEAAATEKSLFDEEALGGRLSSLSVSIQSWLRKHGQIVNSAIPEHQRMEIKECFDMIDTDGSGALDVKEVFELFEALGMKMTKAQVRQIIVEVDEDNSGEIELDEFMAIMYKEMYTKKRAASVWSDDIYTEEDRKKAGFNGTGARDSSKPTKGTVQPSGKAVGDEEGDEKPEKPMPLDLVASAYRRKKMLEGVMDDSGDVRSRMIASEGHVKEQLKDYDEESIALAKAEANGSAAFLQLKKNKIIADRLSQSTDLKVDILNP